ncbi:E3 SUMO-protein ligase ZNF451 isoform X1 [Monodelphis domestica]|uniref:E3 SUMO-protein ligase ZNF451 isoform X1 n=4 Tax=Monodelphis domestica TaxID=13616 RepID=UPI00028BC8F9|nr:E3 SUMO-protein ligase ZNF451 isoform X1 [Monodelphis domestica]
MSEEQPGKKQELRSEIMELSSTDSETESPKEDTEDDIQFVSEGPLRPVLEYIDLVSSDDEGPSTSHIDEKVKSKDYVDREKDRVALTLARLARHVEVEKQQKEEKNKAFREKIDFQHAHGLQELEFIRDHSNTEAARLCVDQWLKMPGLKTGTINSGRRGPIRKTGQMPMSNKPISCPIMYCNKEFDNGHLLLGHLKRFDHSPCDPTITLHGPLTNSFACVICYKKFATQQQYSDHLFAKAAAADGHKTNLLPQLIQCFACPNCFLLFSSKDECLRHMSGKNHFLQSFKLGDDKEICPIPFPSFAKKLLISLCKEVPFQVKCMACHKTLRSHMELTAHFRVHCRNAGPVAVAEKSISQVAERFKARGYCPNCNELFVDESSTNNHKQNLGHKVRIIASMEESILMYCHINGGNRPPSDLRLLLEHSKFSSLKRTLSNKDSRSQACSTTPKRKKNLEDQTSEGVVHTKQNKWVWFCECQQKFLSEDAAEKHVFSANTMCHKCVVCGKVSEDAGVMRLHMSRFHGGAHLNNFLFWCRTCKKELRRKETIMAHVTEYHRGHTYFYEQDAGEEEPLPSSSKTLMNSPVNRRGLSTIMPVLQSPPKSPPKSPPRGKWQCRICEDMFDSEESVKLHCMCLTSHQFHRYSCDHCKKSFHKIETLYRHCQDQHDNDIKIKYFCGLCDLTFDVEEAFLSHYKDVHSIDYVFVSEKPETSIKNEDDFPVLEKSSLLTCGCRESYICKTNRKEDHSRCLQILLDKGNLWFRCCWCSATAQNLTDMNAHVLKRHKGEKEHKEEQYFVKCAVCSKNFHDAESAQQHFHTKHCFLQKPNIAHFGPEKLSPFKFTASGARVDRKLKHPISYPKNSESPSNRLLSMDSGAKNDIGCQKIDEGDVELPDLDYLRTMTHIVFVDFDNWSNFFGHLPGFLNQGTFVWGFQGGNTNWKPPVNCKIFNYLNRIGCFFLHPRCSKRKDAADFAICMHAGRLDEQLPKQIPFTILSGDQGFLELQNQFKKTQRPAHILNPHHLEGDMMCALLNSISDTTKDSDSSENDRTRASRNTIQEEEIKSREVLFSCEIQNQMARCGIAGSSQKESGGGIIEESPTQ